MRKSDIELGVEYALWYGGSWPPRYLGARHGSYEINYMKKFVASDKNAKRPVKISEYSNATADRPVIVGQMTEYDSEGKPKGEPENVFLKDASKFLMLWSEWLEYSKDILEKARKAKAQEDAEEAAERKIIYLLNKLGLKHTGDSYDGKLEISVSVSLDDDEASYGGNSIRIEDGRGRKNKKTGALEKFEQILLDALAHRQEQER